MLPVKNGSYVIAKFVEDIRDVKNGRTYIVLTKNDGLVYKRVYEKETETFTLSSDNKFYDPYEVNKEDILELWEFTCCINTQEYSEEELKLSSIINMFQELKIELKSIKGLENIY